MAASIQSTALPQRCLPANCSRHSFANTHYTFSSQPVNSNRNVDARNGGLIRLYLIDLNMDSSFSEVHSVVAMGIDGQNGRCIKDKKGENECCASKYQSLSHGLL